MRNNPLRYRIKMYYHQIGSRLLGTYFYKRFSFSTIGSSVTGFIHFGINYAVIHILWAIKVCTFWSHNCQLCHQVDIFRFFSAFTGKQ